MPLKVLSMDIGAGVVKFGDDGVVIGRIVADDDGSLCSNDCVSSHNDWCDDEPSPYASYMSEYEQVQCEWGTDCADCGPRKRLEYESHTEESEDEAIEKKYHDYYDEEKKEGKCTDSCEHANDGVCDDGRLGSVSESLRSRHRLQGLRCDE